MKTTTTYKLTPSRTCAYLTPSRETCDQPCGEYRFQDGLQLVFYWVEQSLLLKCDVFGLGVFRKLELPQQLKH